MAVTSVPSSFLSTIPAPPRPSHSSSSSAIPTYATFPARKGLSAALLQCRDSWPSAKRRNSREAHLLHLGQQILLRQTPKHLERLLVLLAHLRHVDLVLYWSASPCLMDARGISHMERPRFCPRRRIVSRRMTERSQRIIPATALCVHCRCPRDLATPAPYHPDWPLLEPSARDLSTSQYGGVAGTVPLHLFS